MNSTVRFLRVRAHYLNCNDVTYTEVMNMSGINLLQKIFHPLEDIVLKSHREVFEVVMVGFKVLVVGFRVFQHFVIIIDVLLYPDFVFPDMGLRVQLGSSHCFGVEKCENVRHHPFFYVRMEEMHRRNLARK